MSFLTDMRVTEVTPLDENGGYAVQVVQEGGENPQIADAQFAFTIPAGSGLAVPIVDDVVSFNGHYDVKPKVAQNGDEQQGQAPPVD